MQLNIDKSSWQLVKFGDVVFEPKAVAKNLRDEGIEHVVGLEHIDAEDIHLKRFASIEESTTFTKKFAKGDVLFGRRRAYLKKAAQAPFGGICSGDITVFRAKNDLLPALLPFVVNNDKFFDYAIKHSAGGLSPRVKFKDLANYEFPLPPKDQQTQLAELLWAMDEVVEKDYQLKQKANIQYEVAKSKLVLEGLKNETAFNKIIQNHIAKNWTVTTIGELLSKNYITKIQDGNHGEIHPKSSDYVPIGIPFIMANTLIDGSVDLQKAMKLPKNITDRLRIGFSYPGDVLLSHKGTVGQVAIVPDKIDYPYLMLTPQVTLYRTNPEILLNKYLYYVFNAKYFQNQITQLSSQSTRAYVGITSQRNFKLAMPSSIDEQIEIINVLSQIENNRKEIDLRIIHSKALQKSLINQIF